MNFNNFDINPQALAVMAYLGTYDGIEASYCPGAGYLAHVRAAPWYNGRERGIVFYMQDVKGEQLNIAVYEHRNSDQICALMWVKTYINPPSLATLPEDVFKDKYDYTESWNYGEAVLASRWIIKKFNDFWKGVDIT